MKKKRDSIRDAIEAKMSLAIFKPNDKENRFELTKSLTNLCDSLVSEKQIVDYLVKCDEENNTPKVIKNNEMVASVFLKRTENGTFKEVWCLAMPTCED